MTWGSTREFMAMGAIAQHFGRPGTPIDQAAAPRSAASRRQRIAYHRVQRQPPENR